MATSVEGTKPAVKVFVATTVMLTFISFWRAAAIVLSDLASSAYYVGGDAEKVIGKSDLHVVFKDNMILAAVGPRAKELLKKAVAGMAKDADLVIYCGCCPMVKCPNVRPAYRTLKEMGFTRVRVLHIPTNMHTDWYTKDYPSEAGSTPR